MLWVSRRMRKGMTWWPQLCKELVKRGIPYITRHHKGKKTDQPSDDEHNKHSEDGQASEDAGARGQRHRNRAQHRDGAEPSTDQAAGGDYPALR